MTNKTFAALNAMLEQLPSVTEATFNAVQAISNATKQAVNENADNHFVVSALVEGVVLMLLGRVSADRRTGAANDALALLHTRLDELAMFDGIEPAL